MSHPSPASTAELSAEPGRFLNFRLGPEHFALPLLLVKEVIAYTKVTPIPQAPPYFLGVMNLRGIVIPVLDLKAKLGMPKAKGEENTVILIEVEGTPMGVLVDSVDSVLEFAAADLSPPPSNLSVGSSYLAAVAKNAGNLVLVMNPLGVIGSADKNVIRNARAS